MHHLVIFHPIPLLQVQQLFVAEALPVFQPHPPMPLLFIGTPEGADQPVLEQVLREVDFRSHPAQRQLIMPEGIILWEAAAGRQVAEVSQSQ